MDFIALNELKTLLIAASPILEIRGSIPIALKIYDLPIWSAYLWSFLGGFIPVIFTFLIFGVAANFLGHHVYFFNRFLTWLFERTRRNHSEQFKRFRRLALLLLVAIPLPFTGAWTGSVAAFVFGIPFRKAFPIIIFGNAIAGLIVIGLTLGIFSLI